MTISETAILRYSIKSNCFIRSRSLTSVPATSSQSQLNLVSCSCSLSGLLCLLDSLEPISFSGS